MPQGLFPLYAEGLLRAFVEQDIRWNVPSVRGGITVLDCMESLREAGSLCTRRDYCGLSDGLPRNVGFPLYAEGLLLPYDADKKYY